MLKRDWFNVHDNNVHCSRSWNFTFISINKNIIINCLLAFSFIQVKKVNDFVLTQCFPNPASFYLNTVYSSKVKEFYIRASAHSALKCSTFIKSVNYLLPANLTCSHHKVFFSVQATANSGEWQLTCSCLQMHLRTRSYCYHKVKLFT